MVACLLVVRKLLLIGLLVVTVRRVRSLPTRYEQLFRQVGGVILERENGRPHLYLCCFHRNTQHATQHQASKLSRSTNPVKRRPKQKLWGRVADKTFS